MDLEAEQHDLEDAVRAQAFEYVVILEELAPACKHQTKKDKEAKNFDSTRSLFMSHAQTMISEGNVDVANIEEEKVKQAGDEQHRQYPQRYIL